MANSIDVQKIVDGSRDTVIKVSLIGDNSGIFNAFTIFDPSSYVNTGINKKIVQVKYVLNGFSGVLLWGSSTANKPIINLEKDHYSDFFYEGGISNTDVSGNNGKILFTSDQTIPTGNMGYIMLFIKSKDLVNGE